LAADRPSEPAFAVVVAIDGSGVLVHGDVGRTAMGPGDCLLVPHAAGEVRIEGDVVAVRFRAPIATGVAGQEGRP
jgi:mannose-6-phosphate isomerase